MTPSNSVIGRWDSLPHIQARPWKVDLESSIIFLLSLSGMGGHISVTRSSNRLSSKSRISS